MLAKYGFDVQLIAREGTSAEKSLSVPPPDMQKAQATIHAYEAGVCGTESPPAVGVVFKRDESSRPYCTALGRFNSGFEKVESSRFDPDVLRTFVTADSFTEGLEALDATVPVAIAADQEAASEWFRTRWSDAIAEFDYDIRRIWLDGTPRIEPFSIFSIPTWPTTSPASRPTSRSARHDRLHQARIAIPG